MKILEGLKPSKFLVILAAIASVVIYMSSCTHDDDEVAPVEPPASFAPLELVALSTSSAPNIDGQIDGLWANAQALSFGAEVPDPGNQVFKGYVDDVYNVTMRAMYDDNNIYFLAEWNDLNKDENRQTWYFDVDGSTWKQESGRPVFDEFGSTTRPAFYEDKFGMLFNVNNSVDGWDASTCYATCHTSLTADQGLARHYTNGTNEKIDMWHWKGVRTNVNDQADDQYQDDSFPNGRHSDSKISGGYTNNKQTLNNGSEDVSVPKYMIPGNTDYFWITQSEIDASTAKLITAVNSDGLLTYDGGTIDPNTDADFQRDGAKGIPSIYTAVITGNRGDITAVGQHTGSGWVLEMSRALQTDDMEAQDVDFSSLEDQFFGVGIFDNAQIAHAIKAGILLKFDGN